MKVNYIETVLEAPHTNGSDKCLIIVVDENIEIKVLGYASGDQTIKVRSIAARDPVDAEAGFDPAGTIADECNRSEQTLEQFFGSALVWAEPLTIAHVVMDFLNNY